MSDTKRPISEIKAENAQLVYRAGQLQYTLVQTQRDLTSINDRLRDLNFEYLAAVEFERQVAEKMAAEKAKETEALAKAEVEAPKTPEPNKPEPIPAVEGSEQQKDA